MECGVGRRLLGHTYLWQGDFIEAQANLVKSLSIYDPERDREARFRFGLDTCAIARAHLAITKWLLAAIAIAQQQKAHSFELRAAPDLARLYNSTGRSVDAHALLASALRGFSPTPEFPEIAEAQTLLAALMP